jgi:hypothetical protein
MIGNSTNETMIGGEIEIGVCVGQTRQSVEGHTANSNHDRQREQRLREELEEMGGMQHSGRN